MTKSTESKTETKEVAPGETPQSLAEASGLTMADATRALIDMERRFREENDKLRAELFKTQAKVEGMTAKQAGGRIGQMAIDKRQCNVCGAEVAPGEGCKKHRGATINEIGYGMKHNRMQPLIVRQVRSR